MKHETSNESRRAFLRRTGIAPLVAGSAFNIVAQSSGEKIKVGQIGTRHAHAAGKMASLRKLSDLYEVVGVVETDPEAAKAAMNREAFQGVPFVSEEALLNTPGLQAVAVETLVADLVPTAMRCLEAGMHVHVDKPAGASLPACRRMHALAQEKKRTIQMGYMFRYNAGFELLFQTLKSGKLGRIVEVTGMIGKQASPRTRQSMLPYSGGGMFELGCHLIDAVVSVLGKPQAVHGYTRRSYPEKDTLADNQLAVFEYPRALATIRCNHLDPFGGPRRQFNVTGEAGTLEIRPLEAPRVRLALAGEHGPFANGFREVSLQPMTGRYDGEFRDLAEVIRGEKSLAWDSFHDLAVHQAVLEASGMPLD